MRIPTLVSERLVLRPASPGDLPDMTALFGDPEAMRFVMNGKTMPAVQVATMVELMLSEARHGSPNPQAVPGVPGSLIIVRPETQDFVGMGVLRPLAPDLAAAIGTCPSPAIEAGYILAKEFWGQGLATEAAQALVNYGIQLVGKEHVIAVAHVENEASHRVLRKVGFVEQSQYDYRDMRMNYWTLA